EVGFRLPILGEEILVRVLHLDDPHPDLEFDEGRRHAALGYRARYGSWRVCGTTCGCPAAISGGGGTGGPTVPRRRLTSNTAANAIATTDITIVQNPIWRAVVYA